MVRSYKDSKKEFLKKYIEKGHSRDMVPLFGEAYNKKHLSQFEKE
jgi:hypothetical protein